MDGLDVYVMPIFTVGLLTFIRASAAVSAIHGRYLALRFRLLCRLGPRNRLRPFSNSAFTVIS